ncbi:flavin reductase family protein [Halostreptopolyspora alba]|uniref:flavin reductase family protein n=1 Tax=Halostreptopolyspora alba TaxID=2487137 RepID=UPI0026A6B6D0
MRRSSTAGATTGENQPTSPGGTPPGASEVSQEQFRRALGEHAAGVVVVTATFDGDPVGVTATSFTSVSLEPPLVSFYIDGRSGTWPVIRDAGAFAVNTLAEDQRDVAARFAAKGVDRFAPPTRWHLGPEGLPLLDGVTAHVLCRTHDLLAVGDHWLVVGRVAGAGATGHERAPLLYHRGRYGRFEA